MSETKFDLNVTVHLPSLVEQMLLLKKCGGVEIMEKIVNLLTATEQHAQGEVQMVDISRIKIPGTSPKEVENALRGIAGIIVQAGIRMTSTVKLAPGGMVRVGNLAAAS